MEVFRIIPEAVYIDLKLRGLLKLENSKLSQEVKEENKNTENTTAAQTANEPVCNWVNFDSKFKWTTKEQSKKKLKKNT